MKIYLFVLALLWMPKRVSVVKKGAALFLLYWGLDVHEGSYPVKSIFFSVRKWCCYGQLWTFCWAWEILSISIAIKILCYICRDGVGTLLIKIILGYSIGHGGRRRKYFVFFFFFLPHESDLASFIYSVPCTLLQIVAVSEEVLCCYTEGYHWYVVSRRQGHI